MHGNKISQSLQRCAIHRGIGARGTANLQALSWGSKTMCKVNPFDRGNITWFSGFAVWVVWGGLFVCLFFALVFFPPHTHDSLVVYNEQIWVYKHQGAEKKKAPNEPKKTISYPSNYFSVLHSFFSEICKAPEKVSV